MMANVIAVIWDCDKTLIDGYMQDPIFSDHGIEPKVFWEKAGAVPKLCEKQGIRVNKDTYYLNYFIKCAHDGTFPGLNNEKLHQYGKQQKFYNGVPEIFEHTKNMFSNDKSYAEYGIQVEHYIVSTGFAEVIRGSKLMPYVDGVWGCELLDAPDERGEPVISEVLYTIDNTTKTRAIFEINKGKDVDVNSQIPEALRRVHFENMIYIADGPSDIPAFSVVKERGGATFAIYPKGDIHAMQQVEQMRQAGRVDMYAEADYSQGTTAYMWITNRIRQMADRIREVEKAKIRKGASCVPQHLT